MKKVLIATFYFYPYSHPSNQRMTKFAKYLPRFGYEPVICTCGNMPWNDFDHGTFENEVKGRVRIKNFDAPRFRGIDGNRHVSVIDRLVLKLESFVLEDRADWALGIRARVLELVERENIDIIMTSSPPHSVHFIGDFVKKKAGTPWVMDLRDPIARHWLPNTDWLNRQAVRFKQKTVWKSFQRRWMENADYVVATTTPVKDDLKADYPGCAGRVEAITNGFDEDDYNGLRSRRDDGSKLCLLHTGRFWRDTPLPFLQAVKTALSRDKALLEDLRIKFLGSCSERQKRLMTEGLLEKVVTVSSSVSHREALREQMQSDVNLIIISCKAEEGGDRIYPGKIFEYLRSGRPVFAVVPRGIVSHLVNDNRLGYVADPRDSEAIADTLIAVHKCWKSGFPGLKRPAPELLSLFDRKNLTENLAGIFDRCVAKG